MLARTDTSVKVKASGQQTRLIQTFRMGSDKCATHWSSRYFKEQLPLASILEERKIAPQLADAFEKDGAYLKRISDLAEMPRMDEIGYNRSLPWFPFVRQVKALAKKSALANDNTFLNYLSSFSESTYNFEVFQGQNQAALSLAVFGHAAANYELLKARADIYAGKDWFAKLLGRCDLFKSQKTMDLLMHLSSLLIKVDGIRKSLESIEDPSGKDAVDEVRKARMGLQGVTYSLLNHIQLNYGLVFVPQVYVEKLLQEEGGPADRCFHTWPSFAKPTHSDEVSFLFGIPFLPFSHASKDDRQYIQERDAVVSAIRWLAESINHSTRRTIDDIEHANPILQNELRKAPIEFGSQLDAYELSLRPNFYLLKNFQKRDWSFPTFRFDIPLKAEFKNLLLLQGKELAPEILEEVNLTLKILDVRRKLYDSYQHFEDGNPDKNTCDFWKSVCKAHKSDEESPGWLLIKKISLAFSGYPGLNNFTYKLNEWGIDKIIGYHLTKQR
jgi:hypothetical protein